MKKRILCVILSLIMLVSLVPAAALTASAAGQSTSESAISILKTLEGYSKSCKNGYTGYGTLCTKSGAHSGHTTSEKEADVALREELKDLDEAVNTFASRYTLSLSQGQHDALVLFSFENGTAWTTGTGDFQTAVKSGIRGSDFLDAICKWDASTADDNRRMIEANMYLNGQYSSKKPSRYIMVTYDANGGKINNQKDEIVRYYDTASQSAPDVVPTRSGKQFMGWYVTKDGATTQVTSLSKLSTKLGDDADCLVAKWQSKNSATTVNYKMSASDKVRLYSWEIETNKKTKAEKVVFEKTDYYVKGKLTIDAEFIDSNDVRWGHVSEAAKLYKNDKAVTSSLPAEAWIKLGEVKFSSGSGSTGGYEIDVTVTVTNSYLRVRAEDSIYSKELRQAHQGDQLRIVNTSSGDGFLWGQIADSDNDGVCEGWVALMYTNFEEVRDQGKPVTSYNVIATATVNVNGYVNVRSGAGTENQIVGALRDKSYVDLYEITYVNGIQWGRYSGGWFCLSYANVEGIDVDDYVNTTGVLNYAFNGKIIDADEIYTEVDGSKTVDQDKLIKNKKLDKADRIKDGDKVTVTNLTADDAGNTWGKISLGWVKVTNADYTRANVELYIAKYYTVVDGVTVRTAPSTSADRVNNLVKGVEFNVNDKLDGEASKQIIVIGDTIWGYAYKVGEDNQTYSGWVNLASKYVARGDAPAAGSNKNDDTPTGEMATIIGADNVNVRIHHDIYSKILGKIARGTTVAILGEEDGWYKLDYDVDNNDETDSWVSAKYVEVTKAASSNGTTSSSDASASVETGLGIVANTYSGVNVRTGAGTGNAQVGKLLPGTTVEILEVTTKGASKWGRTSQGWVCMDYITMINNYEILGALTGGNTGSSSGSTVTGSEVAIYTGTIAIESANIRKTTSLDSDIVRTVSEGTPVTVHEILTVNKETSEVDPTDENKTIITKTTEYWARLNDGYLINPGINLTLDALDEEVYTVTESDTLNVRPGAGTASGDPIFKLSKGDQVVITKVAIVNGSVWGFVEADAAQTYITDEDGNETTEYDWDGEGWISLANCTKGAISIKTETENNTNNNSNTNNNDVVLGAGSDVGGFVTNNAGYRYTGKVINVTSTPLNVRASASDTAKVVTTLNNGASLVIYETYNDGVYAWGRCDAGWVYLYYVDLTPVVNGAVDARVVYNEGTIAYTDMNCTEVAGTYSKMSVIDIYEIVGKMARTDLGWVNTDNLL